MSDRAEGSLVRWNRIDVQRVLYNIVTTYEQAHGVSYEQGDSKGNFRQRKTPRRFIFFGRRLPFLGGDSELLRDAIRIGRETLKDNHWWPEANS
jgi:hypothetical protein